MDDLKDRCYFQNLRESLEYLKVNHPKTGKLQEELAKAMCKDIPQRKRVEVDFDVGNFVHRKCMDELGIPYTWRGKDYNG